MIAVAGQPFVNACPHCSERTTLYAPMVSSRPGAFTLRCLLDNCNRARGFMYFKGNIDLEILPLRLAYLPKLRLAGGPLELTAGLILGAAELHLMGQMNSYPDAKDGAYRGAAVQLRVAAELLASGYILRMKESDQRTTSLGPLIGKIRKGVGSSRVRRGRRLTILSSLDYLLRLGDTAAHVVLRDPTRELPPTKGNVTQGFEEMEKIVDGLKVS